MEPYSSHLKPEVQTTYDPSTNSITVGLEADLILENGYSMTTVQEDFVWGEGYGNGSKADDERCNMMIGGLNSLIHLRISSIFKYDRYIQIIF